MIGIGGSGGTAIVTAGMRALPIGVPKLMVSTLASGDTAPYVGVSDIVMMPSITDLAGLNRISRLILGQAAAAITAMAAVPTPPVRGPAGYRADHVRRHHQGRDADHWSGWATASKAWSFTPPAPAGAAWRRWWTAAYLSGVIDLTTTEVADLLCGGVLPAGPDRLDCIARTRVPWVGSVGACDMVNFWAPDTVPARYAGRLFYHHNANVTLMRTTAAECAAIGDWIARKAEPLRRPGAPAAARGWRLGAGYRGRAVLRPGGRRRAVRSP